MLSFYWTLEKVTVCGQLLHYKNHAGQMFVKMTRIRIDIVQPSYFLNRIRLQKKNLH